ncbi:MAG: MoaD/ThiS family protein [Candidatus Lambdaproteobacteria bacterium]|nr:MoaD/ThiS family protein [Candidatus Lambdaproteobacteria bacterium]
MCPAPYQANADAFVVKVEVVSTVSQFVGGSGHEALALQVTVEPGDTVRTLLQQLCGRYPRLRAVLWEGGGLGPHIEVVVNDEVLGVSHQLDSPLKPGDRLMLLGQYVGG